MKCARTRCSRPRQPPIRAMGSFGSRRRCSQERSLTVTCPSGTGRPLCSPNAVGRSRHWVRSAPAVLGAQSSGAMASFGRADWGSELETRRLRLTRCRMQPSAPNLPRFSCQGTTARTTARRRRSPVRAVSDSTPNGSARFRVPWYAAPRRPSRTRERAQATDDHPGGVAFTTAGATCPTCARSQARHGLRGTADHGTRNRADPSCAESEPLGVESETAPNTTAPPSSTEGKC
jgi:hypothetical protein